MKSRIVSCIATALVAASLASCNGFESRKGISPILNAEAVQRASVNTNLILQALAADAGLDPSGGIDWYLVSEAGFNYVDDQCRAYFDDLFFLNRGREQAKSALAAAGQTTAAILGVTGASSASLAIVAQAFGFSINATDLLAGTYLYQLPPATTQGFVLKLQLAFRDAAAARRRSITSPTIAYHVIQRYLDLCLPPRIEAEITKQISSTTAIPVAQGNGALFSIETASVPPPEALQPGLLAPRPLAVPLRVPPPGPLRIAPAPAVAREIRTVVTRRADEPLPSRRRTPEQRKELATDTRSLFVGQVQKALCVPDTGVVGQSTLDAIRSYLRARPGRLPENFDPMSPLVRPRLQEAVDDVGSCEDSGFKNAYEVGRFGVPDSSRIERITRMQDTLARLLKEKGSSISVEPTGRFDDKTRAGIFELRRLTGTKGDEIDFEFDRLLQS